MGRVDSMALPLDLQAVLAGLASAHVADDQQWILALMRKQGLALITALWRMLGSEQDVLDAYQTAICRLTAKGREAIGSNPAGYFYRTALNAGIEILRSRRRRRESWPAIVEAHRRQAGGERPRHGLDQREDLAALRRAICELPPHLRNVIALRDLGELPYARVCGILGIRAGTARLYRRQAVVRLAELLGREAET